MLLVSRTKKPYVRFCLTLTPSFLSGKINKIKKMALCSKLRLKNNKASIDLKMVKIWSTI